LLGCGLDPAPGRSRECSSMVELQLPKLIARVRFPSLAPLVVIGVLHAFGS
jgi:hypothetical protein